MTCEAFPAIFILDKSIMVEHKEFDIFPPIPTDTANAALLVIGNGNFYLSIGQQANRLFSTLEIGEFFKEQPRSVHKIASLYLISIFQFMEMLSDEQAADAMEKRVDWKFALHLPLDTKSFFDTELCEFRQWLLDNPTQKQTFQILLRRIREITLSIHKPRLGISIADVITQICLQNQISIVWSQFGEVLQILASKNPTWLGTIYLPHWYERYRKSDKVLNYWMLDLEKTDITQAIGSDGAYLLKAISASNLVELQNIPEISTLRQVWEVQYLISGDAVAWQRTGCANCIVPICCDQ